MLLLVEEAAAGDAEDLVDGVAKLQAAILDMHPGVAVNEIAAVDIRDAAGRFPGGPTGHAV
ncbi:hypothetical protein GCM10008942_29870 [Rhizomicrobium electricum]|uniref:Uncharacterized protein n=1 Tax=Rhizomicrobium electricum TaxID=480070 RepID=A0ABP3PYN0_9PROT